MIKEYIITSEPLNAVLDKIDTFITRVTMFDDLHGNYDCQVSVVKNNDLWNAKLKIDNETKYNVKISKTTVKASTVL
jgi:hypothetical protein